MTEAAEGTWALHDYQMETLRTIDRKVTAEFKTAEFEPGVAGDGRGILWFDSVTCGETSYNVDFTNLDKISLTHRGHSTCRHLPRVIEIANDREIFGPLIRLFKNLDTEVTPEPEIVPIPDLAFPPLPPEGSQTVAPEETPQSALTPPGLDPNFEAPPLPEDDDGFPWWGWAGIAAGVAVLAGAGVAWALTSQDNPEPTPPVGETSTQPVASGTTSGVGQRGGRGNR